MEGKTLVELAVKAGRRRQSPQTGYVHFCYENPFGFRQDTIPFYENVCFALALFRTRQADLILEARNILEKLLSFEVGGNFPVYLHEYPRCRNSHLGIKVFFVIKLIVKHFYPVIGNDLREKIGKLFLGEIPKIIPSTLKTPEAFAEALLYEACDEREALRMWDQKLHVYTGPGQMQERGEPEVTLFDLYMGQRFGSFSKRALEDHPVHLKAALLFPKEEKIELENPCEDILVHNILMWGDAECLHSFYISPKKSQCVYNEAKSSYTFILPETLPGENLEDAQEIAFYCNAHPDTALYVNGEKATTFQLGDIVEIASKNLCLKLLFSLESGEGIFFGQIARANRPTQKISCEKDPYAVYDWQISLRTLKRIPTCTITVLVKDCQGQVPSRACRYPQRVHRL